MKSNTGVAAAAILIFIILWLSMVGPKAAIDFLEDEPAFVLFMCLAAGINAVIGLEAAKEKWRQYASSRFFGHAVRLSGAILAASFLVIECYVYLVIMGDSPDFSLLFEMFGATEFFATLLAYWLVWLMEVRSNLIPRRSRR